MRLIPLDVPLPALGTEESETLDFKLNGYGGTDENKREAAADLAQFANHRGGWLILGAKDEGDRVTEYPGLDDIADQEMRLRDVANALLDPRPDVVTSRVRGPARKDILVATVQPHAGVVGVRYQGSEPKYRFPVRIGKRKQSMTFEEVERMWTQDRRAWVLLNSIPEKNRHQLRLDAEIQGLSPEAWVLVSLEPTFALFMAPDTNRVHVPYAFITTVWPSHPNGEHTITFSCSFRMSPGPNKRIMVERFKPRQ